MVGSEYNSANTQILRTISDLRISQRNDREVKGCLFEYHQGRMWTGVNKLHTPSHKQLLVLCHFLAQQLPALLEMRVNSRRAEPVFILIIERSLSFTTFLPTYLGCQLGYHWYTNGIQSVHALDTGEAIPLGFVNRGGVSVVAQVVVLLPMRDDDDTALEADDEVFGEEDFQVVLPCPGHSQDFARRDKPVIIGRHAEVKIQRLRSKRHLKKIVGTHDLRTKHPALRHMFTS
jgi:hypothetical protein